MAGEFTGYYVYELAGANHRLKGIFGTQADADAEAVADTSVTAYQGTTEFPNGVTLGAYLYDTNKSEWRVEGVADLSDLGQKKAAAQDLHDSLIDARTFIMQVAPEKIQSHVQRLLEFEAMAHWANYVAAHMTSITTAQFIAWAEKMREGPDGVTSLQKLFEQVHSLEDDAIPQEACAWVDPADATIVKTLGSAREASTQGETDPWFDGETVDLYDIDLGNGAWIRELTA